MTYKFKLPFEISEEEWPPPSAFIEEAEACAKKAREKGVVLRVMGALAVYIHSQNHRELWENLGRLGKKVFTDIDFMSYGKFRGKVLKLFEDMGYTVFRESLYYHGGKRQIYFGKKIPMVEVFFDKLDMNHVINFNKRLEIDFPTIPLAELLLQKLQVVKISEKDIKDAIVLLRAHEVGEGDSETINSEYISKLLSKSWGFHHTATMNLKKIKDSSRRYNALTKSDKRIVEERINKLLRCLEEQPKSLSWKLRAKVGTRKKWYNEVEEWHPRLLPGE